MPKFTINLPDTLAVEKRDGSSVTVDVTKVPGDMLDGFAEDGIMEYVRDASSTALLDAYAAAHDGDTGDVESRKVWAEDNGPAIAKESERLMADAVSNLYNGIRRIVRTSTADPMDTFRVRAVRDLVKRAESGEIADRKTRETLAKLGHEYRQIPSDDQAARRAHYLAFAHDNADAIDPIAADLKAEADRKAAERAKKASGFSLK